MIKRTHDPHDVAHFEAVRLAREAGLDPVYYHDSFAKPPVMFGDAPDIRRRGILDGSDEAPFDLGDNWRAIPAGNTGYWFVVPRLSAPDSRMRTLICTRREVVACDPLDLL